MVLALVGVGAAFVGLYLLGNQFAPWVAPFLIVPFFVGLLYVLRRLDPRRDGPSEDSAAQ